MIKLPKKVYLRAVRQHWKISYLDCSGKLILVEYTPRQITLYGRRYSKLSALKLIAKWIRLKSHDYLVKALHKANHKVKARFKKYIIRSHEAQWGSYSSNKTLSLNYKLIFLPPTLVKHVIIHELCHVKYLDHSKRFWKEVAKFDKNCQKNRKALDDAYDLVPHWVVF